MTALRSVRLTAEVVAAGAQLIADHERRRKTGIACIRHRDRFQLRQVVTNLILNALDAMDGEALDFPAASFDAALSVFGVILFPDAARGLAEMRRVVRPGVRRSASMTSDHLTKGVSGRSR